MCAVSILLSSSAAGPSGSVSYTHLDVYKRQTSILDIAVPSLTIPVKPGRNLAVIIEVAAMNDRQKKMGFNAAKELQERMLKQYGN